jgi:hypothetical protein
MSYRFAWGTYNNLFGNFSVASGGLGFSFPRRMLIQSCLYFTI